MTTTGRRARICMTATAATALLLSGCSGSGGLGVVDGEYSADVPTERQLDLDVDRALPGGVVALRDDGTERVTVEIAGDTVMFRLDGVDAVQHAVAERVAVTDSEGSGPLKATRQIIVLDDGPLVLGTLRIDDPVIWPGSFEGSPVITIKSRDTSERGPAVTCQRADACLLLSSGVDPIGTYADANDPERRENPVDTIEIGGETVEFVLDDGRIATIPAEPTSSSDACGLSEASVWDVPDELGLDIDDPVLIHTVCPSVPGAAVQLVIMDRSDIPVLAALTEARDGEWCSAGPTCLWFVPQ